MANFFNFETHNDYLHYVKDVANDYLDACRIYGNREERNGLMNDIIMSDESKAWIWDILSKCEGWNGKGQVVLPVSFTREISINEVNRFARFISDYATEVLEDIRTEYGTVQEMAQKRSRYDDYLDFSYRNGLHFEDVVIKGKDLNYYLNLEDKLTDMIYDLRFSDEYKNFAGRVVTDDSYEQVQLAKEIAEFIAQNPVQYVTDPDAVEKVNKRFGIRLSNGVKTSRAVNKMIKATKLYTALIQNEEMEHQFNSAYARYCDCINPLTIKRWTVISINFVDYLTLSNGKGWTSCINTDKNGYFTSGRYGRGFNSRRTLDYALDPCTIVFYTISSSYDGDEYELQPKETRQLFHFNGNTLIQARLYPQSDDSRAYIYPQYREIMERVLCEGMEVPNLWSAPVKGIVPVSNNIVSLPYRYYESGDYIDFLDCACHDGGERDFQSQVNYVILKGTEQTPVEIGSVNAVDIIDGNSFSEGYTDAITYLWG